MAAGLSDREAAKLAGVSHRAIGKARNTGRLVAADGQRITPEDVARWNAARRSPRGGKREPKVVSNHVSSVDGEAASMARAALEVTLSPGGLFADRAAAELARDSYQARLRQLQYEVASGKLIEREAVNAAISQALNMVRAKLLAIPTERAAAIARLRQPAEAQDYLATAITEALEGLEKAFVERV